MQTHRQTSKKSRKLGTPIKAYHKTHTACYEPANYSSGLNSYLYYFGGSLLQIQYNILQNLGLFIKIPKPQSPYRSPYGSPFKEPFKGTLILIVKAPILSPWELRQLFPQALLAVGKLASRSIGEFPTIRGILFWGPYKKDPTIQGTKLGSPIFRNFHTSDSGLLPQTLFTLNPQPSLHQTQTPLNP